MNNCEQFIFLILGIGNVSILATQGLLKGKMSQVPVFTGPTFFFAFCLFRAAPTTYGGSQARGLIGATAASLSQSRLAIRAVSATYTTV